MEGFKGEKKMGRKNLKKGLTPKLSLAVLIEGKLQEKSTTHWILRRRQPREREARAA